MTFSRKLAVVFAILLAAKPELLAGSLDGAPFRLVAPGGNWVVDDAAPLDAGEGAKFMAMLLNTKERMRSTVVTIPVQQTPAALDEICNGIRQTFGSSAVKRLSDEKVTFAGHEAQKLTYEVTLGGETSYNEAYVFIVGDLAWVVSAMGPVGAEAGVVQVLTNYRARE